MTFAEKLKKARKDAGMSQETLADKLGVSRQAVTKWETDRGIPDIDNMMTISILFGISVDEFLSEEKDAVSRKRYLFESVTEYDIDGRKAFDMKFGGASELRVFGNDDEKIKVLLASDELSTLSQDFKVKIDDIKRRIDIDVNRGSGVTEAFAKENLVIIVSLPIRYLSHVEFECNCELLVVNHLECEHIEFDGKAKEVQIDSVTGRFEIDCNLDMNITISNFNGSLEINQLSSTSKVYVPEGYEFQTLMKGIATSVSYEENGNVVSDFSESESENLIEFNGMKSELVICRAKEVF